MTRFFKKLIFAFLCLVISAKASTIHFIVIDGFADYKASIGGGHYELRKADYYSDGNNNYRLLLDFVKNHNQTITISQEEELFVDVINPRQIKVKTDLRNYFFTLEDSRNTIKLQTQKGFITLGVEVSQ